MGVGSGELLADGSALGSGDVVDWLAEPSVAAGVGSGVASGVGIGVGVPVGELDVGEMDGAEVDGAEVDGANSVASRAALEAPADASVSGVAGADAVASAAWRLSSRL